MSYRLDGAAGIPLDLADHVATPLVAIVVRSAGVRASSATTANPRPCPPALAASVKAFKASKNSFQEVESLRKAAFILFSHVPVSCASF